MSGFLMNEEEEGEEKGMECSGCKVQKLPLQAKVYCFLFTVIKKKLIIFSDNNLSCEIIFVFTCTECMKTSMGLKSLKSISHFL